MSLIGYMSLIALLRYRQYMDGDRGTQTDFGLAAGIYGGKRLNAGIFAQTTWVNAKSAQYYYGITAQHAASAGLPAFNAQGGQLFNPKPTLRAKNVPKVNVNQIYN